MKKFDSFKEWRRYSLAVAIQIARCLYGVYVSLIIGFASIIRAVWKTSARWVGGNPSVALGGFLAALCVTWLCTFAVMRARAVGAEAQRDSVLYQYTIFKEQHGFQ